MPAKNANRTAPCPDGSYPLEGAGEEFELDVVVAQVLRDGVARSSAAPRPSRFISCTVKITRWWGTAFLMVRANSIALTNSGRTLIRVLISSEKTGSHPGLGEGVELALELLLGGAAPRVTHSGGLRGGLRHGGVDGRAPLPRAAGAAHGGVFTSSSARSWGTSMKRGVWYFGATLPLRVQQVLPAGTSHAGQSNCSMMAAGSTGSGMSQNLSGGALADRARFAEGRNLSELLIYEKNRGSRCRQ